jgi:hypothetical protein
LGQPKGPRNIFLSFGANNVNVFQGLRRGVCHYPNFRLATKIKASKGKWAKKRMKFKTHFHKIRKVNPNIIKWFSHFGNWILVVSSILGTKGAEKMVFKSKWS